MKEEMWGDLGAVTVRPYRAVSIDDESLSAKTLWYKAMMSKKCSISHKS